MRHISYAITATLVILSACVGPPKPTTTETATISGVVVDSISQKPVIGATVQLKDHALGSMTDAAGRFLIRIPALPQGTYTLLVSGIGYIKTPVEITVTENGATIPPIHLAAAPNDLNLAGDLSLLSGTETGSP